MNAVSNTPSTLESRKMVKSLSTQEFSVSGFCKGDFVVAHLLYNVNTSKEGIQKFYAQIEDIDENSDPIQLKLKYLKQSVGSRYIYTFPLIEDIGYVTVDQISDIVYPGVFKRNRYEFPSTD